MSAQEIINKPPVPRRTQSVKIVRNYSMPNKGPLSNAPGTCDDDPNKYRATRPINRKCKSRRSLDAMEQQASDLLDFLSELENKKESCDDDDFLSFLSDSKKSESGKIDDPKNPSKSDKKFPDRARRISVKDRAKLFLKPDIKEEPNEGPPLKLDRNSNHVKSFPRMSLPPSMMCNNNIKA